MLGISKFIQGFSDPLQAELVLMQHFAAKKKALCGWDRRYAHMQFVLKWGPVFRRHSPSVPSAVRQNPLAA